MEVVATLSLSLYGIVGFEASVYTFDKAFPKITATSSLLALFWAELEDMKIEISFLESIEFSSAYATAL